MKWFITNIPNLIILDEYMIHIMEGLKTNMTHQLINNKEERAKWIDGWVNN